MFRKLLVVCLSVFLTDSYQGQLLALNVVILLALAVQLYYTPYKTNRMNNLEAVSLISTVITFYICTVFLLPDLTNDTKSNLSIVVVGDRSWVLDHF